MNNFWVQEKTYMNAKQQEFILCRRSFLRGLAKYEHLLLLYDAM